MRKVRSAPAHPTLVDVAREAGVSPMTVSRVVRGIGPVDEGTRQRVREAIASVGYVPNSAARGLRGTSTGMIGLIVPDMTNPFFTTLARGVETAARKEGIAMILANSDEHDTEEQRLVSMLISRQVDGLLISPAKAGIEALRLCRARGTPLVFVARRPKGSRADVVRADDEEGAYEIGEHFASLGHVHTAALAGPASVPSSEGRVAAFRRAMLEAGAPAPLVLHRPAFTIEAGRSMAVEAMRAAPRPTAIFAINNFLAMGLRQGLEELSVAVPDEVAIAGFDDFPPTWLESPFLTSANQPAFDLGVQAFAMLRDQQANPARPPKELLLPTELVIRRSSTRVGGADRGGASRAEPALPRKG
jgi:LacI family transcriptional regulator